jgi:hypothetical protein
MDWATRRRLTYISIVFGALLIVGALVARSYFDVVPTCFDHQQNGDEVGVDCGGSCSLYCVNQLSDPKVRWVRAFQVVPGVYNVVAYIEHANPNAAVPHASYAFKLYDENNDLIIERGGTTFIGSAGASAIVESLITTGNQVPAVARFAFTAPLEWQKIGQSFSSVVVDTSKHILDQSDKKTTRLVTTLQNKSRFGFTNVEAVATLYDINDNAITSEKIFVPSLGPLESKTVYFTWPFALSTGVARIEIIPRLNPFTSVAPQ